MINHNVRDFWINDINLAYRCGNVVYINHPKCASTYYTHLFKANDWEEIKFNDIQWDTDYVFGFFMDPVSKHAKGIAEDLNSRHRGQIDFFLSLGETFFKDLGIFGWHCMPLSMRFNEYMYRITWIPLDLETKSDHLLDKFLKHHNVTIKFLPVNKHLGNWYQKELSQTIKTLIGNGSAIIWQALAKDIDLYNNIREKINVSEETWPNIYNYQPI